MAEAEAELARVDERMGDGGNAPAPTVHVRILSHCCLCCHCVLGKAPSAKGKYNVCRLCFVRICRCC